MEQIVEEEGSGQNHETDLPYSRLGSRENDEDAEITVQEKQRVEETARVALGPMGVQEDLSVLGLVLPLLELMRRHSQDIEKEEREHQENREHHERKARRDHISWTREGKLRVRDELTLITLITEQKPSSRKVSMKIRRIGPHTTHRTIQLLTLLQHWQVRLQSPRRQRATSTKSSIMSQVATKTPELSSNLTESYPRS